MKKLDFVKLINQKPYTLINLIDGMRGVVIEAEGDIVSVLFFNPQNNNDYAIVKIDKNDLVREKENIPADIKNEILANLDFIISKAKKCLSPVHINNYDIVELLVEDSKYSKYGVHKGDRGCVMDNKAINDYIEVDFSSVDDNGNFDGDCISVKIEDLKVVKDNKK